MATNNKRKTTSSSSRGRKKPAKKQAAPIRREVGACVCLVLALLTHLAAAVTVLGRKRPGDIVNLETDIIGKYVEKLLRPAPEPTGSRGVTLEFLAENGF